MADSGGHWLNLAEVQKLSQSELMAGVVDIAPKRNPLWATLPMRQVKGTSTKWNRSNARRAVQRTEVGGQLTWVDNVSYTPIEVTLAQFYDQTPLNKFVRDVYDNVNNYEAQQLLELRTGVVEGLNDALVYDDIDYDTTHMRGMHHWAVDNTATDGDIDEGEGALSLLNVRTVLDYMLHGTDYMAMSFALARYIDQYYQEGGGQFGDTNVARATMGRIVWAPNDQGIPIPFWAGHPIIRTDYLVSEQANTGAGSDARAKNTSGDAQYSIMFVKAGSGSMQMVEPGAVILFGGESRGEGEIFTTTYFPNLEDFDAAGLRLTAYGTLAVGAPRAMCRIYDIELGLPTN